MAQAAKTRQVPQKPDKILDAPDFVDDFYLHLLHWSSTNRVAVALATSLFVWNASDGSIEELFARESPDDYVTAVRWVNEVRLSPNRLFAIRVTFVTVSACLIRPCFSLLLCLGRNLLTLREFKLSLFVFCLNLN